MATGSATPDRVGGAWSLKTLAAAGGSAASPCCAAVASGRFTHGDAADIVHLIAGTHVRYPSILDRVADRRIAGDAQAWIDSAAQAFGADRAWLGAMLVAAGPVPGTPGDEAFARALQVHRRALELLAMAERGGCAMGAAFAFVLDWTHARVALGRISDKLDLAPPPGRLPPIADTLATAERLCTDPRVARAVRFGADQLLEQQRAMWTLAAARALARSAA